VLALMLMLLELEEEAWCESMSAKDALNDGRLLVVVVLVVAMA